MKMLPDNPTALCTYILVAGNLSAQVDMGADGRGTWGELAGGAAFAIRRAELRGRSVLIAATNQFRAAEAFIQLDGVVRRMVLYPPDLSRDHLDFVAKSANADVIVTDSTSPDSETYAVEYLASSKRSAAKESIGRNETIQTEWILLTSGTTGLPKLVSHTLASLVGAIATRKSSPEPLVWSTFYDIRRYGGLQIFLRAALTGTPLILSAAQEPVADFLLRAGQMGVSHISGTPSQWRRVLMSPSVDAIAPKYVRLSGEIADQAILNRLQTQYAHARVAHAFASTEAGVVFEVNDTAMGVPVDAIQHTPHVEMKIVSGTLRVRSKRTASRYVGGNALPLKDHEGFVDTGDVLELRDGRFYFAGRRDGTINVAGLKVHPEEVEAVLNRHPEVGMSLVHTKKSSITGGLVVADVVLKSTASTTAGSVRALQHDILKFCREELALYKVPVTINFVSTLAVADSGKLIRRHA
ncbi:MAG: class I adenylate-forming enzyme family protein [Acidobacteriaceae bacterium]